MVCILETMLKRVRQTALRRASNRQTYIHKIVEEDVQVVDVGQQCRLRVVDGGGEPTVRHPHTARRSPVCTCRKYRNVI